MPSAIPLVYLKDPAGQTQGFANITKVTLKSDNSSSYETFYRSADNVNVSPSALQNVVVSPPTNYQAMRQVTVSKVTASIDANIIANNIKDDITILGVTGNYSHSSNPITADKVLDSYVGFVNGGNAIVGTMPNRGAWSWTVTTTSPISIQSGYYSSGTIQIDSTSLSNLSNPDNIKKDVTILGVTGTYEGTWATGASVTVTPYVLPQTIMPSDEGVDCFTEVDVDAVPYSEVANATGTTAVIGSSSKVQIVAGTYTSKNRTGTDYDDYEEVMIDVPWTWNGNSYSILWVRYLPVQDISYLKWVIGNPTNLTPPYGNINLRGYVRLEWNSYFWTNAFTAEPGTAFTIHIDTTTTVTPRQYRVFTKYFQRTGN